MTCSALVVCLPAGQFETRWHPEPSYLPPIMENQMEKKMENEMETGVL